MLIQILISMVLAQAAPAGVIGCSNSRDIERAYRNVSTRDITWSAAQAGMSLSDWAYNNSAWGFFDYQKRTKGNPTAIWWPLCIAATEYVDEEAAWTDFLVAHSRLRQRTLVPLYLTPYLGTQPSCQLVNQALQIQIVDRAIAEGYALKSLPDIPVASHAKSDKCHFDTILSTNIGQAAVDFLDK